jgi:hypothetical protein
MSLSKISTLFFLFILSVWSIYLNIKRIFYARINSEIFRTKKFNKLIFYFIERKNNDCTYVNPKILPLHDISGEIFTSWAHLHIWWCYCGHSSNSLHEHWKLKLCYNNVDVISCSHAHHWPDVQFFVFKHSKFYSFLNDHKFDRKIFNTS